LLNAIATSAAHLALLKASGNFKIEAKPLTFAWIFFLFPQLLLFTPWFLREALAIFLLSLTVLASSYMYVGYLKFSLFLYFLIFPALYFTRGQLIIIAAISLAVSLIYYYKNNISVKNLFKASIIFAFSLLFIFLNQSTLSYLRNLNSIHFTKLILGNSKSPNRTVPPYTSEEFNYSPLGFLYNIFRSIIGPLPWEWKNLSWVALGLDGLFFLALTSLVLYNFFKYAKNRDLYFLLLIPLLPLWIISSLTLANYGLNIRIRLHYLPFLIPLAVMSLINILSPLNERRKREKL
jgi:hypothetical protein